MANQFYVGQRVRAKKYTLEIYVTGEGDSPNYPSFAGVAIKGGAGYAIGRYSTTWTKSSFTPIDQPRTVLTDWYRKQLKDIGYTDNFIAKIESILSKPEPPKFEPKDGEAVLVRDCATDYWKARVFKHFAIDMPVTYPCKAWRYCHPFDAALVGKATND